MSDDSMTRQSGVSGSSSATRSWHEVWLDRLGPLAIILVACALFAGKGRQYTHVHDSVKYAAGAQGFAMGSGYVLPIYESHPRAGLYPPLQSLILSIGWDPERTYAANRNGLLAISLGLSVLSLLGCYWFWRVAGMPQMTALVLLGVLTFHEVVAVGTMGLATDIGFTGLLCVLAGVWWRGGRSVSGWLWLLTGIGLSLTLLWRTAAIAIVGAGILASMIASLRGRSLRPAVLLMVPLMLTLGYSVFQPWGPGGYVSVANQMSGGEARSFVGTLTAGCIELLKGRSLLSAISPGLRIAEEVIGRRWAGAGVVFALLVGVVVWMGAWLAVLGFRKQAGMFRWAVLGCMGLYVLQILVTPWGTIYHGRYLIPVVILAAPWVWSGLVGLSARGPQAVILRLSQAACVLVASINGYHSHVKFREHQRITDAENLGIVLRQMRAELPAETKLCVSIGAPVLEVVEIWGRPILPDYIRPSVDLREASYHRQLGYPRGDYLLTRDPPADDVPGLMLPYRETPGRSYRILRIDPQAEPGFRKARGMPPAPAIPVEDHPGVRP